MTSRSATYPKYEENEDRVAVHLIIVCLQNCLGFYAPAVVTCYSTVQWSEMEMTAARNQLVPVNTR